jgi:hypothetical protein
MPAGDVHASDAAWAASGGMALTGWPDDAPLLAPRGLMRDVSRLGARITAATSALGRRVELDWPALLGERAALSGFGRQGDRSCGGATRLLPVPDGWLAVALARASDVDLLPAWLERAIASDDPWPDVARILRERAAAGLVERAALLGLPVGRLGEVAAAGPAVRAAALAAAPARSSLEGSLVVDLSSLWAGPLCAHLLGLAGARVVKVESTTRPDSARFGPAAFFALLHHGHQSVVLDLGSTGGQGALAELLDRADVVIEASRPRALAQLGIDAAGVLARGRAAAWVSITGHGRRGPAGARVAFGDDAAVAGGLVARDSAGRPCFCADAVADPLAGLSAAAAALEALQAGGCWLLDVALARVAASASADPPPPPTAGLAAAAGAVAPPRARRVTGEAPPLGAHTAAVLAELSRSCP